MNDTVDKKFYGLRSYENSAAFTQSPRDPPQLRGDCHSMAPNDTPFRTVNEMQHRQKNGAFAQSESERRSQSPSNLALNHVPMPRK